MITLKRGDKLPTVAVLQSYLNQQPSTTEFLNVDGNFGPRTEAAVIRYRAAGRLSKGKTVDFDVWKQVVGSEWQVIESIDRSDHGDPKWETNEHEVLAPFQQTMLEFFGMSHGSPVVLMEIYEKARPGELVLLRFHGHGSPGHMIIASGRKSAGSSLAHYYGKPFYQFLQRFRGIFAPFGSIEMHGCRVGKGALGHKLLAGMADAIGVPVSGGLQTQYGGDHYTYRFEGPTNTICPNGESLRNWSLRVGSVSRMRPG